MFKVEAITDPDAAFAFLNMAIEQYPKHQQDPASRRRFLGYHSEVLSQLVVCCNLQSRDLSFKNGPHKLQQYSVDLAADGLPKPAKELGKILDPNGTFPVVIGTVAAPVSAGMYQEYFFGCPGMSNDPQKPSRMFSIADVMDATQAGGQLMLKPLPDAQSA